MGKAARRRRGTDTSVARRQRPEPVPFVARPFAGLPAETEWVALREVLPAATGVIRVRQDGPAGLPPDSAADAPAAVDAPAERPSGLPARLPAEATLATVLPMAWPALHRRDGRVLVATQTSGSSGDASRDLAAQLLAAAALEPGTPLTSPRPVSAATPRLQDLLEPDTDFEVTVHEGFDYWVEGQDLDDAARSSLEQANAAVLPTVRIPGASSAYRVQVGERTFLRLVLPDDEEAATDALARLHVSGEEGLSPGSRLLGAFRACGLLVPVWRLDAALEDGDHASGLASWHARYAAALASSEPLTAGERRARAGLTGRQVTLR